MSNSFCHRLVVSLAELLREFSQIFDTDFFILICAFNLCEFVKSVALIVFFLFPADIADIRRILAKFCVLCGK